jgi:hypothetical protein
LGQQIIVLLLIVGVEKPQGFVHGYMVNDSLSWSISIESGAIYNVIGIELQEAAEVFGRHFVPFYLCTLSEDRISDNCAA